MDQRGPRTSPAPSLPLARYTALKTTNAEECLAVVSRLIGPHGFNKKSRSAPFMAIQNFASLPHSAMTCLYYGAGFEVSSAMVTDSYLVIAPLLGHSRLLYEGHEYQLRAGHGIVILPERTFTIESDVPASALMWKVGRQSFERHVAVLIGHELRHPINFRHEFDWEEQGPGAPMFRAMSFVADELDRGQVEGASRHVKEGMEQILMRMLIDTQPNDIREAPGYATPAIVPRTVRRVEAYIEEHLGEPISATDLQAASGVSGRTMYAAFKKFRGISPMAHVRNLRMTRIREELLASDPSQSVTEILTRWGISQFGRFASAYRNRFGETPSQTLRR